MTKSLIKRRFLQCLTASSIFFRRTSSVYTEKVRSQRKSWTRCDRIRLSKNGWRFLRWLDCDHCKVWRRKNVDKSFKIASLQPSRGMLPIKSLCLDGRSHFCSKSTASGSKHKLSKRKRKLTSCLRCSGQSSRWRWRSVVNCAERDRHLKRGWGVRFVTRFSLMLAHQWQWLT